MTMGMQNFELREFTQAIYSAREAVMQRISSQAAALGASGVVGVNVGHTVRPQRSAAASACASSRHDGDVHRRRHSDPRGRRHARSTAPKPVVDLYT